MTPVKFPEQNVVFAKDQPEYLPLPAWTNGQEVTSCWRLTWRERFAVLIKGRIWLTQLTFGQPLQPQLPRTHRPGNVDGTN